MNTIIGEAIVSCYVNAAALLTMAVLMILSERIRRKKSASLRPFYILSMCVTANCITSFIYNAMYMQPAPWCHTAAIIAKTLREYIVVVTVAMWLVYVDRKLYGEKGRHSAALRIAFVPYAVLLVILTVNLFTGIVFTFSETNRLEAKPLLYIIYAVEFVYFSFSAVIVRRYDRKKTKARFLHVSPMIVSVVLASGTQFFTPYDIGILGYVAGITLLCFSMFSEYRYVDEESGMYNRGYLAYLFDVALAGKSDTNSALILETDGNTAAGYTILYRTLHQDGDVIRVEKNKYLMFSKEASRSTLQYLISLVDEAAEQHNSVYPEEKVHITARCRIRPEKEDTFTFLHTMMDEKEAGDEMRGIVTMISELDRLDKELKLAADIQLSILPMNFPAFPEKKEFDLYASMTPAKEVGGDFYDFFLVDDDHLALVIADVSGKGVPAALFMMVSKTLLKNHLMAGCDPATALERLNVQLYERNSSMMFVTIWTAVLEISTGKGAACNAGHENPVIRRAGGSFELLKYKHGMLVGVNKKARYENREFELHRGDCVFVYTDGVPEATNADNDMFGEQRLEDTLNRNAEAGPEELIRQVHDEVNRFADDAPQFDDITMLCLKYHGAAGRLQEL